MLMTLAPAGPSMMNPREPPRRPSPPAPAPAPPLLPPVHAPPAHEDCAVPRRRLDGVHALLAAYETRPTRPKRSSSERSKEFRAKRKKYENDLQLDVDRLRREVADLAMRRKIWQEKLVHLRRSASGSLIKLIREYFLVFQHGLAGAGDHATPPPAGAVADPKAKYQREFLQRVMDPDVRVIGSIGESVGVAAVLDDWRHNTAAHASLFVELGDVHLVGSDEDPLVTSYTKMHVRVGEETFARLFPNALKNEDLQGRLRHQSITYDCVTHFHFTAEGRICAYENHVDYVLPLLRATGRFQDVIEILGAPSRSTGADCKDDSVKVELAHEPSDDSPRGSKKRSHDELEDDQSGEETETDSESEARERRQARKLSMNFLLS